MKILVIGGVAAGTKTAAKLKREDRTLDVILLTKDRDISYAGCGLPYYVGGLIESSDALVVNTPEKYAALTGVTVHTGREAVELDSAAKTVKAKNLLTGETETYAYDRLVLAVGASPVIPPIEGVELKGVFKMRTPEDAVRIPSLHRSRAGEEGRRHRRQLHRPGGGGQPARAGRGGDRTRPRIAAFAQRIGCGNGRLRPAASAKAGRPRHDRRRGGKAAGRRQGDGGAGRAAARFRRSWSCCRRASAPTRRFWPPAGSSCTRAPSLWTNASAPASPTCTPPATAS